MSNESSHENTQEKQGPGGEVNRSATYVEYPQRQTPDSSRNEVLAELQEAGGSGKR